MIEALRALVVDRWTGLQWRHHGIGALQAYVRENVEPEIRIHVWDPRLVRPGIYDSGSIHDHRFDLESTVLVGALHEREYGNLYPASPLYDGELWEIWQVENARSAGSERGFDGACVPDLLGTKYVADVRRHRHLAGQTYSLSRRTFHETRVDALAVTICTLRNKQGQARLLVPAGREPVHAFGAPAAPELQLAILREAFVALGGVE